jgi:hypothetical protein
MLSATQAVETFKKLREKSTGEEARLLKIHQYLRDDPLLRLEGLPSSVPSEVQRLARLSRVNLLKFAVNTRVQSMYVDGFRLPGASDDSPAWQIWQANGMDARQIGIHRSALSYGASYATVLPGEPVPVIRGASARHLTAMYGDDDVWPVYAVERRGDMWRLIDSTHVYWLTGADRTEVVEAKEHGATYGGVPVCPVVRFRDTIDLDDPVMGIVEPLIPLQNQINLTTFGLLVTQHFGAFKFRYVLGWTAETEADRIKASASTFFTLEEDPTEVQVGQLDEADLSGYINSRKSTMELFAAISQTPAHELMGQLINLSAEALAAAEAGKRRAILENQTVVGESHEQMLNLAGSYTGVQLDVGAYVRWQDTEARALAALVDALGKAVQMLGIPPQALWDRVADALGASQQEVASWKQLAESGDPFAQLEQFLGTQGAST